MTSKSYLPNVRLAFQELLVKHTRPVVALALGAILGVMGQAHAAAKPPCKVISDAAGDANTVNVTDNNPFPIVQPPAPTINAPAAWPAFRQGPNVDALDITSADIAADKKNLTVVIRVKKLALTAPTAAPTGMTWWMAFTADGVAFTFAAHTDPTGAINYDAAYASAAGGSLYNGGVSGMFDMVKNEIHITAANSLVAPQATIKKGTKITGIAVTTSNDVAINNKTNRVFVGALFEDAFYNNDKAASGQAYVVGTPSCVTPGK